MADLTQKLPENAAGQFYVDATCIDCDLCRETSPQNFRRNDAEGHSYVYHQPQDPAQQTACLAALEECPVEAIGNDGSHEQPNSSSGPVVWGVASTLLRQASSFSYYP